MSNKVMLIPGTWAWSDDRQVEWWHPSSGFAAFCKQQGFTLIGQDQPWSWSTDLNGVITLFKNRKFTDWMTGGQSLADYLRPPMLAPDQIDQYVPLKDRNLICHSHGLQPVLFACADYGLKINNLVSVGSPVRKDMFDTAHRARPNIAYWEHIYSDKTDYMQWLGELFDGHLGVVRQHPLANINCRVPQVGHSKVIYDPTQFHLWIDNGWFDILKGDYGHVEKHLEVVPDQCGPKAGRGSREGHQEAGRKEGVR